MSTVTRVPAEVFPPGEFVRDELEARGWTQADLAVILNKPLPAVNEIITGKKAITPETAKALGDVFDVDPQYWLNLENSYRLSLTAPVDENVAKRAKLYSVAPIKELIKRKWVSSLGDTEEMERQLLSFYRVSCLEDIGSYRLAARKSSSYSETSPAEMAWYCRALQMAETLQVGAYSEKQFLSEAIPALHQLTNSEQELYKIPQLLAKFGVRFLVLERLQKMPVDGAAFWLDDNSPVIAMTLRADRIDGFWFTLAHELAHIINRDDPTIDSRLVGKDRQPTEDKPEHEKRADEFASEFLIPSEQLDSFILRVRPLYSKVRVNQFANRIGVHPGIVVGQLQHRREIGWEHSREMLVKIRGHITASSYVDGFDMEPEMG
jgi:HTH-type transcriptional regulator / antitoxin HigA